MKPHERINRDVEFETENFVDASEIIYSSEPPSFASEPEHFASEPPSFASEPEHFAFDGQ